MMWSDDLELYPKTYPLTKLKVVGLLPNPHFQKCRYLSERLHSTFPKEYDKPEIRAMFNLDWDLFLTKMKQRHGKPFYLLEVPVVVYVDNVFLGNDKVFVNFLSKKFRLDLSLNFDAIAENEVIKYFGTVAEKLKRQFVYFTIAVDEHVIGSMLFELYNDVVPIICHNFFARCTASEEGYQGTKIHRIAKPSWIQCGGGDLEHYHMPCENYGVPHNRRGVLSMCNLKRHEINSAQFFITLEDTTWMDYSYVAFGQLVQGAEVLKILERIETYYEKPLRKIEIVKCGEFSLCVQPDDEYLKAVYLPYKTLFKEPSIIDFQDSLLSCTGYNLGKYCLRTDLRAYLPFTRYSRMFDFYLREIVGGRGISTRPFIKYDVDEEGSTSDKEVIKEEIDKFSDDFADITKYITKILSEIKIYYDG